jgi:hypothetical protein
MLGLLGLAGAGCGSAKKAGTSKLVARSHVVKQSLGPYPKAITVTGHATLPNPKAGTQISCKGGEPTVSLPLVSPTGESVSSVDGGHWSSGAAVSGPGPSQTMRLKRAANGAITVSCGRK